MWYDVKLLLKVFEDEIGYLEKRTSDTRYLYDKTANAGSNNFTKYWADLAGWGFPDYQGCEWCDGFVDWGFVTAYGKEAAKKLQCGGTGVYYTPDSAQHYKDSGRWHTSPKVGDQIFFRNSERIRHTGIVVAVNGDIVTTIEGNTSGASGMIPNGGGVRKKTYNVSDSYIAGYGRPDYGTAEQSNVEYGQEQANKLVGTHTIDVDGERGPETRKQGVRVLQTALNKDYGAGLEVDGECGPLTVAALGKHYVAMGETQWLVTAAEILLYLLDKDPNGVEHPGTFGKGLKKAAGKNKITAEMILGYLD